MPVVKRLIPMVGLAALLALPPAHADHERAYQLRESGSIVPLQTIIAKAQKRYGGHVLEAELEEDGGVVYEVELLDRDGVVHELLFDARSGELLKSKREKDD